MRKLLAIFCFVCFIGISFDSLAQPYVIYDTIPIRHGTNKLRLYRNVEKWFKKEKGQKLIAKNWKELQFKGKGYFPYVNYVKLPDVYLSSHAAEKTKGSIIFSIDVSIQDSIIVTKFSNFIHEPRFTEYGTTSFGRLMAYDKVPSGICMEVEEWCNAVWADMKAWAYYETKTRAKNMIPSTLVRKRTYKAEDEKEIAAPTTKQKEDPNEYLNIDNYILKDTVGKYADYNKDPEEIAAERAAAEAALAAKEKKKQDEHEDEYESEDGEYMDQSTQLEEAPTASENPDETETPSDEDELFDDEEIIKPSKEKTEKSKKEKAPKAKKKKQSKKSKSDDYDDDYDDYEDDDY